MTKSEQAWRAAVEGPKQRLAAYRAVRDALCVRLETLFKERPGEP